MKRNVALSIDNIKKLHASPLAGVPWSRSDLTQIATRELEARQPGLALMSDVSAVVDAVSMWLVSQ